MGFERNEWALTVLKDQGYILYFPGRVQCCERRVHHVSSEIRVAREARYWLHSVLGVFLESRLFPGAFGGQQTAFPALLQRGHAPARDLQRLPGGRWPNASLGESQEAWAKGNSKRIRQISIFYTLRLCFCHESSEFSMQAGLKEIWLVLLS